MAKIGLAAELAKQAAQAAREEVAAQSGEADAKPTLGGKGWTVPVLPDAFMLDEAMDLATRRVAGHYRNVLAHQGLNVDLETADTHTALGTTVSGEPHQEPLLQAHLREQVSGRLVKAYTTPALLTMYAAQQQATGIVVDGQV